MDTNYHMHCIIFMSNATILKVHVEMELMFSVT
jgi:hypothetical protein